MLLLLLAGLYLLVEEVEMVEVVVVVGDRWVGYMLVEGRSEGAEWRGRGELHFSLGSG